MGNKIKVGDYVRTKFGIISKIIDINVAEFKDRYELENCLLIYKDNIIKSSSNILDLLEPQDLMYIDIDNGWAGGIVVPRIAETLAELNEYIDNFKNKKCTLVGVVTHEQLYSLVNKVGEDNE